MDIAKMVKRKINEAGVVDADRLNAMKKESEVYAQHIKAFNNSVLKVEDNPSMGASVMTIVDLLSDMFSKEDEDMIKNIARLLQLWKSGSLTEPELTKFILDHAFNGK